MNHCALGSTQKRETPRTGDAVAGPVLTICTPKIPPRGKEGNMPKQHEVEELPSTDQIILAGAMRDLALAAKFGTGTYLTYSQCVALADQVHAVALANGQAVLYETAKVNPTLSTRAARAREAERMDVPICAWCTFAITPSNPHDDCGPGKVTR